MQLANLLVAERKQYELANELYKEAARAGNRDALWHLGYSYWHGHGVEQSRQVAWELWKQGSMHISKYAKLRGVEGLAFALAKFVVDNRIPLLAASAVVFIYATGGDPLAIISASFGGGGGMEDGGGQPVEVWEDDGDDDDFDDFDEE